MKVRLYVRRRNLPTFSQEPMACPCAESQGAFVGPAFDDQLPGQEYEEKSATRFAAAKPDQAQYVSNLALLFVLSSSRAAACRTDRKLLSSKIFTENQMGKRDLNFPRDTNYFPRRPGSRGWTFLNSQ
jgi:hypothetical protein